MRANRQLLTVVTILSTLALPASATGLLDKVKKGAQAVGETTGEIVEKTGETIESTAELVTEDGTPAEIRAEIDIMANDAMQQAFIENTDARNLFDQSAGYAVFDARNINWGVAAGYGRGVAVSRETDARNYMRMASGGVGWSFGVGGFATRVVMLFENPQDFNEFVTNGYDGTAGAGSMMGDETADQSLRFVDGRSIFTLSDRGLKVQASAVGTRYWTDDDLNS